MGHQHHWCSYPPEGKLRRNKTWDEQEWDEEEMVTNARVLEDVEDLRDNMRKDAGFKDSSSWPTLTEWCSSCLAMRSVKFIMPVEQEEVILEEAEVTVSDGEKAEKVDTENCPDAGADVGSSEPRANRKKRKGGRGSRLRRLLVHQLLLTEKRGLPLSRLLCLRRTEAKSQVRGRREQEESASPMLRRRRPKVAGKEREEEVREGVEDKREDADEIREKVESCSKGALTGDSIFFTPRSIQTEVTKPSSLVYPQIPGTPPFPHLTPLHTPIYTPPYTPPYTLPFTPPYTPLFTPLYTSQPVYPTPPYTPPPCGPMPGLQWLFCGGCQAWGTAST